MNDQELISIAKRFQIDVEIHSVIPFGGGHINDSYQVICPNHQGFLLQRVNHFVFQDIPAMMQNINLVLEHLRSNGGRKDLELCLANDGSSFLTDDQENFWRMFHFISGTKTLDLVESPEQAYQGGLAFGDFLRRMEDLQPALLNEVMPNFHNIIHRLLQLKESTKSASVERLKQAKSLLGYIWTHSEKMAGIERAKKEGLIPVRITHNDTKFNNFLLDRNDRMVCVIDLDTVMPGVSLYDVGDGIRSATNAAREDEQDLGVIQFDIQKFTGYIQGYLDAASEILKPIEISFFAISGALFSYMMSVRFLTDYLQNDPYYKVSYEQQNLHRAICQLELSKKIMQRQQDLDQIIRKLAVSFKNK